MRIERLVAEYGAPDLGIGTAVPRLSWTRSGGDGEQDAYELRLTSADGGVDVAAGAGPEQVLVAWPFRGLRSRERVEVQVRVQADGAWSAWSEPLVVEAGLLSPEDVEARFVSPRDVGGLDGGAVVLARDLELDGTVASARLYVTAHGVYDAWIGDRRVGDHQLDPGWTTYDARLRYQTFDVTEHLQAGATRIAVGLGNGWYRGQLTWTLQRDSYGDRLGLLAQLEITYADGRRQTVVTDERWRAGATGVLADDLYDGQATDLRVPLAPAAVADGPVDVLEDDVTRLVAPTGPPVREVATVPAREVLTSPGGAQIVDFGQNVVGWVRLRVTGERGGTVTLRHAEVLEHGELGVRPLRDAKATDTYVLTGGEQVLEPRYTFHGFRYAEVTGAEVRAEDAEAVVVSSDLRRTGWFECSEPDVNRLHENVVWSQRGNFLSVPTDCPQRERAGWTGDIQAFVGTATDNAQVVPFLSRWLDNLRADQLPDGRIPIFSPRSPFDAEAADTAQGIGSIVAAAGWSDAIAIVPWTLYERTGDRRVLEENDDALLRWIEYQRATAAAELPESLAGTDLADERRRAQALLYNTGLHFGDWLTPSTMEGRPTHEAIGIAPALTSEYLAPMFQARTLTISAQAAAVLGRERDAEAFAARAADVRAAFAAEYIDADGDLPVRLQGVYVLALAFDMVPPALRARTAARLVELIRERGNRLDTGFLSTPYLLDVLCDNGYSDVARTLLWQSEMPSWLYEVDRGATTIWETWDAMSPDGEIRPMSFNHYAPGSVDDWLYRRVAGIRSTSPGYRTAVVEPDFDAGVDGVRAHVGTPFGRFAVEWTRTAEAASVIVDVPFGVSAHLVAGGVDVALEPGRSTHVIQLGGA